VVFAILGACGGSGSNGGGGGGGGDVPPETEGGVPQPLDGASATFSLTIAPVVIRQGATGSIVVDVQRTGSPDAIDLSVRGLPPSMQATPSKMHLGPADTVATFVVGVAKNAPQGAIAGVTVEAVGTSTVEAPVDLTIGGAFGSQDTTFGGATGYVSLENVLPATAQVRGITRANGDVYVAYTTTEGDGSHGVVVALSDKTGAVDTTFGTQGVYKTNAAWFAYGVYAQASGRILLYGNFQNGARYDGELIALTKTGTLDTSFSLGSGRVALQLDGTVTEIWNVTESPGARIYAGGRAGNDAFVQALDASGKNVGGAFGPLGARRITGDASQPFRITSVTAAADNSVYAHYDSEIAARADGVHAFGADGSVVAGWGSLSAMGVGTGSGKHSASLLAGTSITSAWCSGGGSGLGVKTLDAATGATLASQGAWAALSCGDVGGLVRTADGALVVLVVGSGGETDLARMKPDLSADPSYPIATSAFGSTDARMTDADDGKYFLAVTSPAHVYRLWN
jgi:hypothetical protein